MHWESNTSQKALEGSSKCIRYEDKRIGMSLRRGFLCPSCMKGAKLIEDLGNRGGALSDTLKSTRMTRSPCYNRSRELSGRGTDIITVD